MPSVDTTVIESVESIRAADPGNMLDRIKDLGKQVRDAWQITKGAQLPPAYADVSDAPCADGPNRTSERLKSVRTPTSKAGFEKITS